MICSNCGHDEDHHPNDGPCTFRVQQRYVACDCPKFSMAINTPFGMTPAEHLASAIAWIEERKQRFHAFDCTVHKPDARCSCGLHKCLTDLRAVESFGELKSLEDCREP